MVFGRNLCSEIKVLEWRNKCDFLLENNLDVWRVFVPDFISKINQEKGVLNSEEMARSETFLSDDDRNRYLIGKIYLRKLLANYLNLKPEELQFSVKKFKKPCLVNNPVLNFNISHSGNYVMFGLSNRWAVGIDIELMNTKDDLYSMLQNTMSSVEAHAILSSDSPRDVFYKHWTRKESLLKCIGVGLIDNIKDFNVCDGPNIIPSDLFSFTSTLNVRDFTMDRYAVSVAYDSSIRVIRFYEYKGS